MNKKLQAWMVEQGLIPVTADRRAACRAWHKYLTQCRVVRRVNGNKLGLRKRGTFPTFPDNPVGRFAVRNEPEQHSDTRA